MNRDLRAGFRLSVEERAALLAIARAERRRPSEALREMIRTEAKRRGLWPPSDNGARPRVEF